jgi:hypothetical protein
MIFQQVLSEYNPDVPSLRGVFESASPVERLASVWQAILDDIDYIPIFRLARSLVVELTGTPGINDALEALARSAQRVTARRAALRHDLMGRIFHKLLTDAKFFGAYYTTVPAATLLLKLALDPTVLPINWSSVDAIRVLRIGDMACGTGTLLKAALQTVVDNNVRASAEHGHTPPLKDVHKVLVEEVLCGLDVVPFAIHLAATALALHEPEVPFGTMHLVTVPLGATSKRSVNLGSIELFHDRRIRIQADLYGGLTAAATRVTAMGDRAEVVEVPPLDLCVMNPPFTRSVGGNLLFGNLPAKMRTVMQTDLKRLVDQQRIEASITAGLGSVFTALGHRLLKPEGQLALVLPRAVLSGVAWGPNRQLLAREYHVRTIVVSHEPGGWNFSENSKYSECLITAKRLREGEEPAPTKAVNLWRRPRNSIEALAVAQQIINARGVSLTGNGTDEIRLGEEKIAEVILLEPEHIRAGQFNDGSAFAQTDLSRAAAALHDGRLFVPGQGNVGHIPLTILRNLGELGPDVRDIGDGFRVSNQPTPYRAFKGHTTESTTRLEQSSNSYLAALPRARPRRPLRDANLLWGRAGHIMLAERLRLTTARVVAIHLPHQALSTTSWWPLAIQADSADERERLEKIVTLWLNSTLGVLTIIAARVDTEGPWIKLKKPILHALLVLDPDRLSDTQRQGLAALYDEVGNQDLRRLPEIASDTVRARIDAGMMNILGFHTGLLELREMLSREPLLRV